MNLHAGSPDAEQDGIDYLVSHGKSGGFGRFVASWNAALNRGDRVIVESRRGREIGTVLCPATPGHVQLLASIPAGRLVRRAEPADEDARKAAEALSRTIFTDGGAVAAELGLPLAIVDVDVLLDQSTAFIQYLGPADESPVSLVEAMRAKHGLAVLAENLAVPVEPAEQDHAGCDKPDCGRVGGGGCTSCSTGGGCSSCGTGKVDMTAYFAHLRTKIDERVRTSLL